VTVLAEIPRRVQRLPAAPLLAAIDEARAAQGIGLRRMLSSWQVRAYFLAKAEGTVTPYMIGRLCAVIGRCPHELYGDDLQEIPEAPEPAPVRRPAKLSADPLVRVIEARLRRFVEGMTPLTDLGAARGEAMQAVFGEDEGLKRAFYRARRRGWVLLEVAERFCDAFGWHPREIWGDAYDAAAFAGLPADFDAWEGVA
jgi:hypothetical protein